MRRNARLASSSEAIGRQEPRPASSSEAIGRHERGFRAPEWRVDHQIT